MTPDVQNAVAILFGAAQQARLTAPEHVAVQEAFAVVKAALTPKPEIPPADPAA